MQTIAELERRITSALERIGHGLEAAAVRQIAHPVPEADVAPERVMVQPADAAELGALRATLEEERSLNAQLTERLRAVKERDQQIQTQHDEKIEKMTRQLDIQGLDLQRMRKMVIQLREQLRTIGEAQKAGLADSALVNRALQGEVEALRAVRLSEVAEIDEILAELAPLIEPKTTEAPHA
jgi:hypothetical protein